MQLRVQLKDVQELMSSMKFFDPAKTSHLSCFFQCLELMWVSVHDTSDSCVALLWLFPFVKACYEKYNQCFSGGMMIICALLIKCKLDASQTFVTLKVSRYDIPSIIFLKNQGYHLTQQI